MASDEQNEVYYKLNLLSHYTTSTGRVRILLVTSHFLSLLFMNIRATRNIIFILLIISQESGQKLNN